MATEPQKTPAETGFNLGLIRPTASPNPITPEPLETPGLARLLRNRPTLNRKRTLVFLSLRKWPSKNRESIIAAFKESKARDDQNLARFAGAEIGDLLRPWLGTAARFTVTAPPAGVRRQTAHFASVVDQAVASRLGIQFEETFAPRMNRGSSFPKKDEKRGKLRLLKAIPASQVNWILVDDVATSASTLEAAVQTLIGAGAHCVIPVCWVYESADHDLPLAVAAPESDGMPESVLSPASAVAGDESE